MSARQIHLAGFLIAGNCAHSHAIWRHPASDPGFLTAGYYQEVARSLERGLFDLVFFADRLAMSSRYGGSIEIGARYGDQDATRLDPIPVLASMAAVRILDEVAGRRGHIFNLGHGFLPDTDPGDLGRLVQLVRERTSIEVTA